MRLNGKSMIGSFVLILGFLAASPASAESFKVTLCEGENGVCPRFRAHCLQASSGTATVNSSGEQGHRPPNVWVRWRLVQRGDLQKESTGFPQCF